MRRVTAEADSDTFSPMSAMVRRALCESSSMIWWSIGSRSTALMARSLTKRLGPDLHERCATGPSARSPLRGNGSAGAAVHRHGVAALRGERGPVPGGPAILELEPGLGG